MSVTAAQLKAIMPLTKRAEEFAGPLTSAMDFVEINTPLREAMFLAQIAHESSELRQLKENLNYSADGLKKVFGKYFKANELDSFARQQDKIANRVYANRYGNGNEASGDGWRYRGRGLIQLTFKDNYSDCAKTLHVDLIASPAMLEMAEFAAQSAAWFWRQKQLNDLADAGDIEGVTQKINGGLAGLDARKVYYEHAKAILNA